MRRRTLHGKRVLVTGASSGIGQELARQLAVAGARLLITARRAERLKGLQQELAPAEIICVPGDIASADVRHRVVHTVDEAWGGLDILVNNAGVGAVGTFVSAQDERRLRQMMEINFFAPADLIRQLVPRLRRGTDPLIVNIGSVLGHVSVPNKSEYCASKFALRALGDSLRAELRQDQVSVLWVAPNTTRSEFFSRLIDQTGTAAVNPWSQSPAWVAQRTIGAIRRRRSRLVLSWTGRWLVRAERWAPRLVHAIIARFSHADDSHTDRAEGQSS